MMRDLLLIIHILAAGAWIGGSLYSAFAIPRHAANYGVAKVMSVVEYLGIRYFGGAFAVLVLSGVGLVLISDVFGWGTAFVLIGIAIILIDGILEATVLDPALRKSTIGEPSHGSFARAVRMGAGVHFALLAVAVWAMVVKPGL